MQGEFKAKRIASSFNFDIGVNWKPAATLMVALLVLFIVSLLVESHKFKRASEEVDQQTKVVFKDVSKTTNENHHRQKT